MKLFTVGHSNHMQAGFLHLLQAHGVDCVVDVRSVPASKHNPQFNQEALQGYLRGYGIDYQFYGHEFGARRPDCINEEGQVDFELASQSELFLQGVKKLCGLVGVRVIALMCSEANPLECHRFALVARYFHEHGHDVFHIMNDARLVSHSRLEQEMIKHYLHAKKPMLAEVDELFGLYTSVQQLCDAYWLKNKEIGYRFKLQEEYFD